MKIAELRKSRASLVFIWAAAHAKRYLTNIDTMRSESYDVLINRNIKVIFPNICVVCKETCSNKEKFRANPDGYFGMWIWLFGGTKQMSVPCHPDCSKKLKKSLLKRNLFLFALVIPALIFSIYYDLNRIILLIIAFILMLPAILWQIYNPPPLEFQKNGDEILYTFQDQDYAKRFASINNSKIR